MKYLYFYCIFPKMTARALFFLVLVFAALQMRAQQNQIRIIPDVDTLLLCQNQVQALSYFYENANPTDAPAYLIDTIPFQMESTTGTTVSLSDDANTPAINIGFNFNFWGTVYQNFHIHSNGFISFHSGTPNNYVSSPLPNNSFSAYPVIFAAHTDLKPTPSPNSGIRYQTIGTAPFRKLVVTWENVPFFSCTHLTASFQIVLHETHHWIDIHIGNKPVCETWAGGTGLQAINANFQFLGLPERNGTVWTAINNSIRFTPNAFPHQINWFINAIPAGSNPSINAFLTPTNPNRMYVLRLVDGFTQETFLDTLQVMPGYEIMQLQTHPFAICKLDSSIKISYSGTNFHSYPLIWDFDGAEIVNGTNGEGPGPHELRWDTLGTKTITVSKDIPLGCTLSTKQQTIGYTNIAKPVITYNDDENKLFTEQNYAMYQWFVNHTPISNSNQWFISPQQSGEYYVVATGAYGCKDTSDAMLIDVTNINSSDHVFYMFPNPASTEVFFRSSQIIHCIAVYDCSGRKVLVNEHELDQNINISSLSSGM